MLYHLYIFHVQVDTIIAVCTPYQVLTRLSYVLTLYKKRVAYDIPGYFGLEYVPFVVEG